MSGDNGQSTAKMLDLCGELNIYFVCSVDAIPSQSIIHVHTVVYNISLYIIINV